MLITISFLIVGIIYTCLMATLINPTDHIVLEEWKCKTKGYNIYINILKNRIQNRY